jgi:hypothetical protein
MHIVHATRDELLEHAQQALDLIVGNNLVRSPSEESLPEPDESGDVSSLLPEGGGEKGAEEVLVGFGEGVDRVELEELGEDLEDVGDELWVEGSWDEEGKLAKGIATSEVREEHV